MSAMAMSTGRATSMRLSGATTVTRLNPVAAVVLTFTDPLFADAYAAGVTLPVGAVSGAQ
ncbi:hypothetical protein SGFS_038140 [Streptomyces graminofaciens]|uniref:Uncharacterized protein n=1 Tax=Streptomyces graminofaciens TaxID=68212 RepID=A0ABM7F9A2_9ACTN|nr:hypothetical protein SGFS_038140 [Streptomyces graminofaciens]